MSKKSIEDIYNNILDIEKRIDRIERALTRLDNTLDFLTYKDRRQMKHGREP